MNKYGFLFGAGAEVAYDLPTGGHFALDIFREDTSCPKEIFKQMRETVDKTTSYANDWLPKEYLSKNILTFGKSAFLSIIKSTLEHNRRKIIDNLANLDDDIALNIVKRLKDKEGLDIDNAFYEVLGKSITNIKMGQIFAYNDALKDGDQLFESSYFSGLLTTYQNYDDKVERPILRRVLLSIMQLQLGALSENLARSVNDNLFKKKDDSIDLFDDFGSLIRLDYSVAGVSGLEYLLEGQKIEPNTPYNIVVYFALLLLEEIYALALDYKSLIDSYWHYLYNPSSDWSKFCRISIFLLTVYQYITRLGDKANKTNPNGYYNMLRVALKEGEFDASGIATTNYNILIEDILERKVVYLNGSVAMWYDPYLNKVGTKEELNDGEHHIIVPLLFTQSGTKPMTSISMSIEYVDLYNSWKESDAIVVVGFGFGGDDEHINGILRTL